MFTSTSFLQYSGYIFNDCHKTPLCHFILSYFIARLYFVMGNLTKIRPEYNTGTRSLVSQTNYLRVVLFTDDKTTTESIFSPTIFLSLQQALLYCVSRRRGYRRTTNTRIAGTLKRVKTNLKTDFRSVTIQVKISYRYRKVFYGTLYERMWYLLFKIIHALLRVIKAGHFGIFFSEVFPIILLSRCT